MRRAPVVLVMLAACAARPRAVAGDHRFAEVFAFCDARPADEAALLDSRLLIAHCRLADGAHFRRFAHALDPSLEGERAERGHLDRQSGLTTFAPPRTDAIARVIAEQLERQHIVDPYLRAWVYVTTSSQVPEMVDCLPDPKVKMPGECDGIAPVPTGRMMTQTVEQLVLFDTWGVEDSRAMRTLATRELPLVPSR